MKCGKIFSLLLLSIDQFNNLLSSKVVPESELNLPSEFGSKIISREIHDLNESFATPELYCTLTKLNNF